VKLGRLFAPEHGLTGAAQDLVSVGAERDALTGLAVVSLYGKTLAHLAPEPRALEGLGALVVDLQDVGARYYTFVWTMALAMRAAARAGLPVIVLDRPNPLGGEKLEGNVPDPRFASFVGLYPLPTRHGMTIGELAGYLNDTHGLGCDLTVVPMLGWRRAMRWEDTGLPWVAPSPNMPTPDTARVYPGGCLVEGTNLSEGRGTTRPFEWIGAPFLDGARLEKALTRRQLPGVRFRAMGFEPAFHKWKSERCAGVQVHVTDPDRFQPVATYVALLAEARRQAPRRFRWRKPPYEFERRKLPIDLLGGGPSIRRAIERGAPLARLEASWRRGLARFARARRPFLLYR
ncbi:MAG: exo-beta-N-acetylmuramidase NamZ family protein, partial [Alphaproteobacteria bacterium]